MQTLMDQVDMNNAEILAVGYWGIVDDSQIQMKQRYPDVRWLTVPTDTTVPQMRTCGILQSQGEIIALLEDDCVVSDGWYLEILKAHKDEQAVVGGSISPGGYHHWLDWAVYFCEYARFMPPFSGVQDALPGNHVTYKRTALPTLNVGQGFYEVFIHSEWLRTGGKLIANPALSVKNVNQWSVRHISRLPFHHGRAFAGMRAESYPIWRKILYTMFSIGLPVVKAARLAGEVAKRRRYLLEFLFAFPWTMIFLTSWSLGEMIGYASGPGHSADEWR